MRKLRLFLSSIVLQTMHVFASHDGRLADDPYHRSPTWLYVVIGGLLIYAVVNGIRKSLSNSSRRKNIQNQSSIKSTGIKNAKVYKEYGRNWDECPDCKGSGYVRGLEVPYLFTAPNEVGCDVCKGYGHILTPKAEELHIEYCELYNSEMKRFRKARVEHERSIAEERRKLAENKRKIIQEIKNSGRSILTSEEYRGQIEILTKERNSKISQVMNLLKDEPICQLCQNNSPKMACPVCRGTGHILTEDTNQIVDEISLIYTNLKSLRKEYQTLYLDEANLRVPQLSLEHFLALHQSGNETKIPEHENIRNRIMELLKDEPNCPSCKGAGSFKVSVDSVTNKAYIIVSCKRCNGRGKLYYD